MKYIDNREMNCSGPLPWNLSVQHDHMTTAQSLPLGLEALILFLESGCSDKYDYRDYQLDASRH